MALQRRQIVVCSFAVQSWRMNEREGQVLGHIPLVHCTKSRLLLQQAGFLGRFQPMTYCPEKMKTFEIRRKFKAVWIKFRKGPENSMIFPPAKKCECRLKIYHHLWVNSDRGSFTARPHKYDQVALITRGRGYSFRPKKARNIARNLPG